ncbi:uncharacterized protein LOC100898243 [Galendromus occidentalis]|uniref:Uncharacterized protein LOC100898243 n=1 Tax=Galendromus occidentalis TaxID=34638 RepID=A0AAJ6VVS2_9ACAR|nr:uncharacterized protein LOC100898243 [Galendromus occidentalis]
MKFFILLLGVGLVLARERSNESAETDADNRTESGDDVNTETQVCRGEGTLIARLPCTEVCRRPFEIGRALLFNVIHEGEPCKTSRRLEENDGTCAVIKRFGRNFGICRADE